MSEQGIEKMEEGGYGEGAPNETGRQQNRPMTVQEMGHLGGTALWHGREAAEKEKEKMGFPGGLTSHHGGHGTPQSRQNESNQGQGSPMSGQGGEGQQRPQEMSQEKQSTGSGTDRGQSGQFGQSGQAGQGNQSSGQPMGGMTPQEFGHLGGIARWHGREAAEQEKEKMGLTDEGGHGQQDQGQGNRQGGRSQQDQGQDNRQGGQHQQGQGQGGQSGQGNQSGGSMQGGLAYMSPQEMGHLGGVARWQGREAEEQEKEKMGLTGEGGRAQGQQNQGQGNRQGGQYQQGQNQGSRQEGQGQMGTGMTPQEMGHLGGTGRWHGREAVEEEKKKMGMASGQGSDQQGQTRNEASR